MLFSTSPSRQSFTKENKKKAITQLIDSTAYSADFKVLLVGSIIIAAGAIFTDSVPVLIASMIIAPLATPILALGLGIVAKDGRMMLRALAILVLSCVIALMIAAILTFFFGSERVADTYISFNGNRLIAFGIAVAAGFIGAYGMLSPKVASAVTGVAIAVSLMPPLVATGINFVSGNVALGIDAGILFIVNVVGILLASLIVFWRYDVSKVYRASKR
jgi:uncharacterized hydrophobic protein (TIGR00341 family)